jgi:hypothetical protein
VSRLSRQLHVCFVIWIPNFQKEEGDGGGGGGGG